MEFQSSDTLYADAKREAAKRHALDAVKTERSPTMADTIEATGCTLCELEGTLEAMARVLGEPGYPSCCEQEMPFDLPTRLDLIKGSASRCLELARRAQQRLS